MQGHKPQFSIVYRLLYKMIVECPWPDCGCWVFISSHGAGKFVCIIKYSSWNRYQSRGVNDVFPPDDPWFDSETERKLYIGECLIFRCLTEGAWNLYGVLPFSVTGCPVANIGKIYLGLNNLGVGY